jgi:hypothetical protein
LDDPSEGRLIDDACVLLCSRGVFAMFEYSQSSQAARSRVAAERYAVVSAAVAAKAERKRVRGQARVARRARAAVAEVV